MSKIVKALEKAEEAQRSAEGIAGGVGVPEAGLNWLDEPVGPSAQPARPASSAQSARSMPQAGGGERRDNVEVRYERTKIEQACFHKMEERRLLGDSAPRELRDAFNVVRTRILQQTRAKGLNTIMVTTWRPWRRSVKSSAMRDSMSAMISSLPALPLNFARTLAR